MIRKLKKSILKSKKLLSVIGLTSQLWYVVTHSRNIRGQKNILQISNNVIMRGGGNYH